jgi:hypothetical protein
MGPLFCYTDAIYDFNVVTGNASFAQLICPWSWYTLIWTFSAHFLTLRISFCFSFKAKTRVMKLKFFN